ncbi:hypothetical protein N9816_04500 [Gammaproteobacteria bacterium]|nr:hypothetical protein [Gammaproteobacteria bacterium]
MADNKDLSAEGYEQAPEYQQHLKEVLASYDHPKGLLGELVGQLADAFWWIKVYRRDKEHLILFHMTSVLVKKADIYKQNQQLWLSTFEALSEFIGGAQPDLQARKNLNKLMTEKGHNIASLRAQATRDALPQIDTLDRLIDRQFKNIRLLMQAHDSAKFAPQLYKKLDLEIKQLELQVKKSDEDQRLEVARQ